MNVNAENHNPRFEHRIEKGTTIMLRLDTLIAVSCLVASTLLVNADRLIPKAKTVWGQLMTIVTESSTDRDQTNKLNVAGTIQAAKEAWSIIKQVRQSSNARSFKRSKRRNPSQRSESADSWASTMAKDDCWQQSLPKVHFPLNVPVTWRCENGRWRARYLPSLANS